MWIQTCFYSALTEKRFCHFSLLADLMGVDMSADLSVYGETLPPLYLEAIADETRHDWRGNNGGIRFHQSHQIRSTISPGK